MADVSTAQPEILGVGICPSQGIRKGVVIDVEAATEAIAASLRRAEQQSGFKALSAFVGIACAHIQSCANRAGVTVRSPNGLISVDDVDRVIDGARIIQLPPDQEILHVIPQHYVVDGAEGIRDPVGMVGRRLELEASVVTGSVTSIHNLVRCVEGVDLELDGLVLEPLAAGQAILTEHERERGTMVVDMGGGTTDAAVFRNGVLIHSCVLPVGGHQISSDLAFGLRSTLTVAEELKIRHGSTISHARPEGEMIPAPAFGIDDNEPIEQRAMAEIIDARLAETFELVAVEVSRAGFGESYPTGIVVTGGSAQIPGAPNLAAQVFAVPARLGAPTGLRGSADTISGPAFSTSVGLLCWGREQLAPANDPGSSDALTRLGEGLRTWLRNFLP
jgi:cell division protein FtsA